MRAHCRALIVALVFTLAPAWLQGQTPTYSDLVKMPADEREAAIEALPRDARNTIYRTHIDRWLTANRHRLNASQVALVEEARDLLKEDRPNLDRMTELTNRMRCELWHSDVVALSFRAPDRQRDGWWSGDVAYWLRRCVIDRLL